MQTQTKQHVDPMIEALVLDNDDQVGNLINKGVDPNENVPVTGKKFKNKPLHYAAFYNSVKAAKKLIAAGADLNGINGRGATPFQVAEMNNAFNILQLFRETNKERCS